MQGQGLPCPQIKDRRPIAFHALLFLSLYAIGKSLEMYLMDRVGGAGPVPASHQPATAANPSSASVVTAAPVRSACPDCGSGLVHEEGCVICHGCGFSECF